MITKYTLSQYYEKVKSGKEDILEIVDVDYHFSDAGACAICGGVGCAKFHGYYERGAIDEKGVYHNDFPVPRFKCRRKGTKPIVEDKTFSLLHFHLIPFRRYPIWLMIQVLFSKLILAMSFSRLQAYLDKLFRGSDDYIDLSSHNLRSFKKLIDISITKMMICGYYPEAEQFLQQPVMTDRLKAFLAFADNFCCYKTGPAIRGPCALSVDYYLHGGSYRLNAHFLFGTPSQWR
jgi:hypothetical protein